MLALTLKLLVALYQYWVIGQTWSAPCTHYVSGGGGDFRVRIYQPLTCHRCPHSCLCKFFNPVFYVFDKVLDIDNNRTDNRVLLQVVQGKE
ncbi:hypothetical protein CWE14_11235 [Aliidiomarina soli]|uniref:Uncharacterized protein n=1 Tax=Aliidiomarina soli TaxID=1928574 RepID=A0A432WE17_9GAMM|nr:hypothetical protein CWE14_11235 [Aliidiomarina soli]